MTEKDWRGITSGEALAKFLEEEAERAADALARARLEKARLDLRDEQAKKPRHD